MINTPIVWIIVDHRIGNVNQCIGVANALGFPYLTKHVSYNATAKLPNVIKRASLIGIDQTKSDPIAPPWPDIVIAAGRRCASVALYIKKQSQGKTFLTQLMWPGKPHASFDLIAVPQHDHITLPNNALETRGAPHKLTQQLLDEAKQHWQPLFSHLPQFKIGLIVGGSTARHEFTMRHAKELGATIAQMATKQNAALLVSTSRRTSTEATKALKDELKDIPSFFHQWGDEGENPYMGILSSSNLIVVTGDSMSMCSECCFTGQKVYIYAPKDITSNKHSLLHQQLYDSGNAIPFMQDITSDMQSDLKNTNPLNEAERIANHIKKRLTNTPSSSC